MKKNRAEEKDVNDCKIMEALIEDNKIKELVSKFNQNIFYFKIKIRVKLVIILNNIGLYGIVKGIIKSGDISKKTRESCVIFWADESWITSS